MLEISAEQALRLWTKALTQPDQESLEALRPALSEDVVSVTPLGRAAGVDAVTAALGQSPLAGFFGSGTWSDVRTEDDTATVTCTFPAGAPVGGVTVTATTDGSRLTKVETTMIPAAPPEPIAVDLGGDIAAAVNAALANGTPVIVAYVDEQGQPHLSLRGTAQVLNQRQLAMWSRSATGGLPTSVAERPRVAVWYRDAAKRVTYQFHGLARVENDEAVRRIVFDNSPEVERNFDPRLHGAAVVVDVTRVEGRDHRGSFVMDSTVG